MLLAQMTQFSPAQLGTTLTILIVIAGGYWKLRRMEDYMRGKGEPHKIKPQPLVVKEAEEFATLDRVVDLLAETAGGAIHRQDVFQRRARLNRVRRAEE